MLRIRLAIIIFIVTAISCGKEPKQSPAPPPVSPSNTFFNPVLPSGPDPWVIKKDNFYYYTHTLGNRIAIWKTSKMTELKNVSPQVVWSSPPTGPNSKNVWAPELHFINNKWYAYYTAGATSDLNTQRSFVLENDSDDPRAGTWVDKGKIFDPNADFFAIDGTILSHNGSNYFIWSGEPSATDHTQNIYIARMSNPWTLETARSLISTPQYAWEKVGAPPAVNEGPEILKSAGGKVFLIFSASGCWSDDYSLGMLTLTEGSDPLQLSSWTKNPVPVFTKNTSGGAFGPGHNSFFKSADGTEDWMIYHANPSSGLGCGDARSPRIQKLIWNADGTPNFGQPTPLGTSVVKPAGE